MNIFYGWVGVGGAIKWVSGHFLWVGGWMCYLGESMGVSGGERSWSLVLI